MKEKSGYRSDIDGLRAVAVLSVVFYHAGIKFFTGGYIGVDVFFVISGFLITGLISREILSNNFSILSFYERRIRRIFPAFFVVTIAVAITGGLIYDAETYRELGKSIVASSTSVANLFFLSQAGYFDRPSLLKPLLHTWSLSVEEQFYFFLPIILIYVFRFFPKKYPWVLLALLLTSLTWNVFVLRADANSAFYLAQLRAWELLVGSLIALKPMPLKNWLQNSISFFGLLAILFCVFTYNEVTSFPGMAALLPVLGTAMIINSGLDANSLVNKFLSLPPIVFFGKISYSLYLWHWPILVFGKYYLITPPSKLELAGLLFLTLFISILSWKFIETPFRSRDFLPNMQIFGFSANILAFILLIGVVIDFSGGFPLRFDSFPSLLNRQIGDQEKWDKCVDDGRICNMGIGDAQPEFLLWGDSHAQYLAVGIDQSAILAGKTGAFAASPGCAPFLGIIVKKQQACFQYNNNVLKYIKENTVIKKIILASRWAYYYSGTEYKQVSIVNPLVDTQFPGKEKNNQELFEIGLERTISELTKLNLEVIIISPIPEIGIDPRSAFFISTITHRNGNKIIAPIYDDYIKRNGPLIHEIENIRKKYPIVRVIDISRKLCNAKSCQVIVEDQLIYRDSHHLNSFGASLLSKQFSAIFIP